MGNSSEFAAVADSSASAGIGTRYFDLKKSFKFALRSLLTACSKEEFNQAFPTFTSAEKEWLHQLFLQVITSLHENIEDGFELVCLHTRVGATLDTIEQIVEQQDLDPLYPDKENIMDVAKNLSSIKKNEVQHLTRMVQLAEERNHAIRTRVQHLREGKRVLSSASDAVEKIRSSNLNYGVGQQL